ncbi:MAG: RagB/SusD family nutrient uptake outer membrane protein [Prevotellaceae bacterium]|nr:RagB/SusD family nutrient uptake outer membrane protein [Prevotellaceae bacterium]
MKKTIFLLAATVAAAVSCNDYLDTLPDNRVQLDTEQKIAKILVSAYPTELPVLMFELMSDNITDNGPQYSTDYAEQTVIQSYLYKDITDTEEDSPTQVWSKTYIAIAAANNALDAIEKAGNPETMNGSKCEALLCRAFGHFVLVTAFCKAYNEISSATDPGIPYITAPETSVKPVYGRGTVKEVYEKINRDIEEALPLHSDNFVQPAYHFNRRAAYAFAARFNLFYGKWEKTVQYATEALGDNPASLLRDFTIPAQYTMIEDVRTAYLKAENPCNLLIMPQQSLWGRVYTTNERYGHSRSKTYITFWQNFPWNGIVNGMSSAWGIEQNIWYPKMSEIFEMTNHSAQTGNVHTVLIQFTADEVLACRAEAYAMLKDYENATKDLNYWYWRNSASHAQFSKEKISEWYSVERPRSPRYPIDSRFSIEPGMQENFVRAALAIRRFDGVHTGMRWLDIKRHGITVKHPVLKSQTVADTITLKPYDDLTAIQLPADVISAGLPANPRGN